MTVTVITDTSTGDSGKGKLAAYLVRAHAMDFVVSGGTGPSAAHMVDYGEGTVVVNQVPLGYERPDCKLFIGPGTLVDVRALEAEVHMLEDRGFDDIRGRLTVDPRCGIVPPDAVEREREAGLHAMGLTWESGTTAARADYVWRRARRVESVRSACFQVGDVPETIASAVRSGRRGLMVNPHGPSYSLYSGPEYPYTTSDECSVAAGMSRAGLGWSAVTAVIGVCNMLPTTTAPITLQDELDPQEVARRGLQSRGSVSGRVRRVAAHYDLDLLNRFVHREGPSMLALGRMDLLVPETKGVTSWQSLPLAARAVIDSIEASTNVEVAYVSTGPKVDDIVQLREERPVR